MDVHAVAQQAHFPLVQYMTTVQLQELLDKDEKTEAMVQEQEMVSTQKQQKEMVIVESQSIADYNLSQERRLMEGRQRLLDVHKQNREARENYDRNKRKLDELSSKYSIAVAKKMLETSASKKEDDAEEIASRFMDGEMTADEFLDSFQRCRLDAHTTRIKAEKMSEVTGKLSNYVNTAPVGLPSTPSVPPRPAPRTASPAYLPPQLSYDKPSVPARSPPQMTGGPGSELFYGNAQPHPSYPQPQPRMNGGIQYY